MLIPAAVLTWAMPAYFPGWGWGQPQPDMQRVVPSPGTPHPLSKLTVGSRKKQYPNLAAEGDGGYTRVSHLMMMLFPGAQKGQEPLATEPLSTP